MNDHFDPPAVPRPAPRSRRWLVALAVVPLVAACTLTTEDPSRYGAVTEANVLDGCVAQKDPAYAGLITIDEQGSDADDIVVVPDAIPAEVIDPCQCFYDGIVEEVAFSDFDALDRSLRDLPQLDDDPETADEAETADDLDEIDEDEERRAETLATLAEIAEECGVST